MEVSREVESRETCHSSTLMGRAYLKTSPKIMQDGSHFILYQFSHHKMDCRTSIVIGAFGPQFERPVYFTVCLFHRTHPGDPRLFFT